MLAQIKVLTETNQTLTDSMHALAKKICKVRMALYDESLSREDLYDIFITKEKILDVVGGIIF